MNSLLLPGNNEAPKVLAAYPAAGAQGLDAGEGIWVLFSIPMDTEKTQTAFHLSSSNGNTQGSFRWDLNRMFFIPKVPLSSAGEYTMIAGRGSESIHGLDLQEDFIVRFFAGGDTGKPSLISSSPADGTTGVMSSAPITLTFSEPIDFATVLSGISVSPPFLHTMTLDSTQMQVTIVPTSPLVNGTNYTVTVKTSVKDLTGNALNAEKTISFTVGTDTLKPSLVSVTSGSVTFAEGVTTNSVERAVPLVVTFSEAMDPVSAENALTLSPSVTSVKTWLTPSALQVTASLSAESNYTIAVDTTAADAAGNTIARSYSFPFYTDGVNSVRPMVVQAYQERSNAAGACTDGVAAVPGPISLSPYSTLSTVHLIDVQTGAGATCVIQLRLDFNRNIDRTSLVLATSFVRVIDPSSGTVNVHDVSVAGNVASIQLSRGAGTWPFGSGPSSTPVYKLRITSGTSGVKDIFGNTMSADYELFLYF